MKLSVIIINYNVKHFLEQCLYSVQKAIAGIDAEVIVVDNNSADDSVGYLQPAFPRVCFISNKENIGFGRACNQGFDVAKGNFILYLNPDTIILDGAIDKMLGWLDRHPGVGCVGCQVLEGPGVVQRTCFADPGPLNLTIVEAGLMRLAPWLPVFGRPWYRDWDRRSEREVDVVSGMFMLVPRAVLGKVGLLDEAFFVYGEEADWCRRIRKAGWSCVFAPVAQIVHLDGGSKSTEQIKSRMYVQMQKSHLIYARKHHGLAGFLALKAVLTGSAALRVLVFASLGLVTPDETTRARVRLSRASLAFLLAGREALS